MKFLRMVAAIPVLLVGFLAFAPCNAQADEAWRLRMEQQRRLEVINSMSNVAQAEEARARAAACRVDQTGRYSDPTWKARMNVNAANAIRQYEVAFRAYATLRAECAAYLAFAAQASRFIYVDLFPARTGIEVSDRETQILTAEMNRNRTFWYTLGLQF